MFNYNNTLTNMSISSIEDTYITVYTKGHVKPWTYYRTTNKEVYNYFWIIG